MQRDRKGLRAILNEITQSADRSPLFWWLIGHRDELTTAAFGRRLQWARLYARFAEMGLTDATGKPASVQTARMTWHRVRQSVAKIRLRVAAQPPPKPGAVYPSRVPKDWRPQLALPAPQSGPGPTDADTPYDPLERIAEIRREMMARSGRKE
jgi:hypothetical protein